MRIRADEHVSREIVRIICELALSPSFEFSSIFDVGHDGSPDQYWATEFAKDGGDAILTADTDFFRKPNQIVGIDRTGLKVIHLPSKWANFAAAAGPHDRQGAGSPICEFIRRFDAGTLFSRPRDPARGATIK